MAEKLTSAEILRHTTTQGSYVLDFLTYKEALVTAAELANWLKYYDKCEQYTVIRNKQVVTVERVAMGAETHTTSSLLGTNRPNEGMAVSQAMAQA